MQYNERVNLWSSNLRFGLLADANTGLFVVYNDIQYFDDALGSRFTAALASGRTLTVKYSHLFNLLR